MEYHILYETFGKWFKINDSIVDLRKIKVTSRRRQNLHGALLTASMVITNNNSLNHLDDHKYNYMIIIFNFLIFNIFKYTGTSKLIQSLK